MKCEECLSLVEEYADDELDGQTSDLMIGHLKACAACASAFSALLREQELYLRYECDALPQPAFWDKVFERATAAHEQKIAYHRVLSRWRTSFRAFFGNFSAPRFSPSLMALMLLIAIGVTAITMSYFNTREKSTEQVGISQSANAPVTLSTHTQAAADNSEVRTIEDKAASAEGSRTQATQLAPRSAGVAENKYVLTAKRETPAQLARTNASGERRMTPESLLREAELKYVAAINLLARDLNRRRSQLDAETAAQFDRTLMAVDRTIADTRRAARKHPDDPVAARYMLTAYAKKVEVLREMIGY